MTDDRRIVLTGAVNFRDLGGYRARDGRTVRWRRVFRSDSLAELTDDDVAIVSALGLRTVFDLRAERERRSKPNRDIPGIALHAIGFLPYRADVLLAGTSAGRFTALEIETHVREIYRRFPLDHNECYGRLLRTLTDDATLPALVHCTSGRDRTGFAAAAVLLALGVPRETVFEDYALTEKYRRDQSFLFAGRLSPEIATAISQARRDYLEAAFRSIDEHWGSDEGFVRDALSLPDATRDRLRELLLEDAPAR